MKKWVLSFGLSLITIPIISGSVWASGSSPIVVEEEEINCDQLYLLEFSADERRYSNDRIGPDWLRSLFLTTSDKERYMGDAYLYEADGGEQGAEEVYNIYFTPLGIFLRSGSRCPIRISQENALLILQKCGF
ncbi:MAG: hypothetical protein J7647_19490 [Cyanobacteria bacterium SBLK]|nr:hypothetical protein [Cyanobacteria bacterium SBLK]